MHHFAALRTDGQVLEDTLALTGRQLLLYKGIEQLCFRVALRRLLFKPCFGYIRYFRHLCTSFQ